ncbi:MAG: DUF4412 domain-containing protein [Acidobacteria bacterium]|nr:DUF4412 domain-containing protein [Acidobacteriota bacterium]
MKYTLRLWALGFIGMSLISTAWGGHHIVQKMHVDPIQIQGQNRPATDVTREMWIEAERMATYDPDQNMSMIVRLDEGKILFVRHAEKVFHSESLPLQMPPDMQKMMAMFQFKTDLQRTGNRKQINGWNCEEIVMTLQGFMNMNVTLWCTGDISLPFASYYKMAAEMASLTPAVREMLQKMQALGNLFPVRQEMTGTVMGVSTRTTVDVVTAEEMDIPAERFAVPEGFREEKLDFHKLLSNQ